MAFSFVHSLVKHTLKFGGNALGKPAIRRRKPARGAAEP